MQPPWASWSKTASLAETFEFQQKLQISSWSVAEVSDSRCFNAWWWSCTGLMWWCGRCRVCANAVHTSQWNLHTRRQKHNNRRSCDQSSWAARASLLDRAGWTGPGWVQRVQQRCLTHTDGLANCSDGRLEKTSLPSPYIVHQHSPSIVLQPVRITSPRCQHKRWYALCCLVLFSYHAVLHVRCINSNLLVASGWLARQTFCWR